MISLRELVQTACPEISGAGSIPALSIEGVECDSRKVGSHFLFVVIRGNKLDGHQFIDEAVRRGAVALILETRAEGYDAIPQLVVSDARLALARLASVFYGHPSRAMKMIGITGTNGKTTSSYLIEHLLEAERVKTGVIGTINYRFGGQEIPAVETTPGSLRIQQMLSEMRKADCRAAVMEVSSHALDQKRAEGIDFQAALFTNLTQDHLDYHKTMENYFESKAHLFLGLQPSATAVINADDDWGLKLKERLKCRTLTYGVERKELDYQAQNIRWESGYTLFELNHRTAKITVRSPLVGLHNVYNVLGALATVEALGGFSLARLAAYLETFPGVPGRLEAVNQGQGFMVFIDFAHTPDGLENVLKTLKGYKKGKLIAVFGCGGDRDRGKRPKMAKVSSGFADQVIVTSDNPRSEDPKAIAMEVCEGFPQEFKNYSVVVDRRKAIRLALLSARDGDIVLLAGKGHERTQIIGKESLPFSDREEAERVLCGR